MPAIDHQLIENFGLTLLHFLWQGALIGILYWVALLVARPASARIRYNLAVATLLALGLTPLLTFAWLGSASAAGTSSLSSEGLAVMRLVVGATGQEQAASLLAWTVAAWLAGVAVLSGRLVVGWHYINRLKRSARRDALSHLLPALDRLRSAMTIRKSVALAVSDRIPSPVVVGWLKPLILFPPALVTRLSTEQVEMVLAHELAHIRRHDHLINLIQIVIETLLFYHPAVALVSRQIRIERENACDDLAVASTQDRLAYVEMLASLERFRQPGPSLTLGLQDGQIIGRIRRLVERSRPRRQIGVTLPALLGLLLLAGSTGLWFMPGPDLTAPANAPSERLAKSIQSTAPAEQAPPAAPLFSLPPATTLNAASVMSAGQSDDLSPNRAPSVAGGDENPGLTNAPPALNLEEATASLEAPPLQSGEAAVREAAARRIEGSSAFDDRPRSDSLITAVGQPEPRPEPSGPELAMASPTPTSLEATIPSASRPAIPELTGGELLRQVQPSFPHKARRWGVNGIVELEFTVDESGEVTRIGVIDEQPGGYAFGDAARAAIQQWRFEPYRRGEATVERQVRLEVEFDLAEICSVSTGSRLPRC